MCIPAAFHVLPALYEAQVRKAEVAFAGPAFCSPFYTALSAYHRLW